MSATDGEICEARGRAAHASADYITAVSCYEAAFAAHRAQGDLTAAARAARTVGWFQGWVFGEWSVHRGWLARARALLEDADTDRAHGWMVFDDAQSGRDLDRQRAQYREAIDIARRSGDHDLECDATASLGMMLIFSGFVDEGMAHLDAALAAICGGEVTELPVVEGCLCGLLTACEHTRDVPRAEQWLRAAERVMERGNLVAVAGHCRSHYAGILVTAGRWADAEDELAAALDMVPPEFPVRATALCRLAGLRVRQGRYEEAEHLLVGLDHHEDAAVPLASLHLARSQHEQALEVVERALASGSQESHRVAPLVLLAVQGHLDEGDLDRARVASERLTEMARQQPSAYLTAAAADAHARVATASGDGTARTGWHQVVTLYADAKLPEELARARLELARVAASDRTAVAIAEAEAAFRSFEELGSRRGADEAAALLRTLGAPAKTGPKRTGQLTRREEEVLELLADGRSNAEIAERLYISPKTVEHHVSRILAKLGLRSRAEVAAHVARERHRPRQA